MSNPDDLEYSDYQQDEAFLDDEDYSFLESPEDGNKIRFAGGRIQYRNKRTWRDAEKYREMRELYRLVNDELYTGINEEDIF